jgi:hypothetical protein
MKLPVTVTAVTARKGGLYAVTVAYFDGTVGQFLIPPTLATVEAVTISALAMATLSDMVIPGPNLRTPHHRRYAPRL